MTEIVPFDFDGCQTAPTEHEFALDHDTGVIFDYVFDLWRWICSCGERGNWQSVSDDAAERGWLQHCGVGHDYAGEG